MEERIPPHSDDAERSVLGAVMKNKEALFDVLEILTPEDFYSEIHKEIFGAVRDLNRASSPVDVLTVSEELKKRKTFEDLALKLIDSRSKMKIPAQDLKLNPY